MKTCIKCLQSKSLDEFHRHSYSKDGHIATCKSCRNKTNIRHSVTSASLDKETGLKYCHDCKSYLTAEEFPKNSSKPDGLHSSCKKCHGSRQKSYSGKSFGSNLKRYQMTVDDYYEMLADQGGVCKGCKKPETAIYQGQVKSFAVDHDHSCCSGRGSCGKCIRGLLCQRCNLMEGHYRNDIESLKNFVTYIESCQTNSCTTP